MSYHILQQFDAPCLSETGAARLENADRLFKPSVLTEKKAGPRLVLLGRRVFWLLTLSALLAAVAALFFALDARRRADVLQERLTALERQGTGK